MTASRKTTRHRSSKPATEALEGRALLSPLGDLPTPTPAAEVAPELPTYEAVPLAYVDQTPLETLSPDLLPLPDTSADPDQLSEEAWMTLVASSSPVSDPVTNNTDTNTESLPLIVPDPPGSLVPDSDPSETLHELTDVPLMATSSPAPTTAPQQIPQDPRLTLETLRAAFLSGTAPWRAAPLARPPAPAPMNPPAAPSRPAPAPPMPAPPSRPVATPAPAPPTRPGVPAPPVAVITPGEPVPASSNLAPPLLVVKTSDQTPPQLNGLAMRTRGRELLLTFNEPLDPTTATDPASYRVEQITPQDYRLQTAPGDAKIAIYYPRAEVPVTQARYDETTRTVTLALQQPVRPGQYLALSTRADQPAAALRDRAGNPIDGNGDGIPDGYLQAYLPRPRGVTQPPTNTPRPRFPTFRLPPNFRRG